MKNFDQPILYRRVSIPDDFLVEAEVEGEEIQFGGDIRIGALSGDEQPDFLIFRSADSGMKPCFIGAFTMDAKILWQDGRAG